MATPLTSAECFLAELLICFVKWDGQSNFIHVGVDEAVTGVALILRGAGFVDFAGKLAPDGQSLVDRYRGQLGGAK